MADLEIFLITVPGLEVTLGRELTALGAGPFEMCPGGLLLRGTWPDVWDLHLRVRGASRILVRFAAFRALHLAQLDKRARRIDWRAVMPPDTPFRVDVTCRKSRIYHETAARQRIGAAIAAATGLALAAPRAVDATRILVRIADDLATFSMDASGAPLHKRGSKRATGKAPLRETMASLFLRDMGVDGGAPLVDPMCGSGTFVLEAAEMAAGLAPGRHRSFAFETFPSFDPKAWKLLKAAPACPSPPSWFYGFDRDIGAVSASRANADAAGVGGLCTFERGAISDLVAPDGPKGHVVVNPPYGARIGQRKLLFALYGTLGSVLAERFRGWKVGLVTSDEGLARATALDFHTIGPPVPHGGLKVRLYQAGPL